MMRRSAAFPKAIKANEEIFFGLAITDIKNATDLFKGVFDEANGADGFVSLEVYAFPGT